MFTGMYKVVAGASTEMDRQTTIARNLNGSNIPGFRREYMKLVGFNNEFENQMTGFTAVGSRVTDHNEGLQRITGRALDFALSGPGFFKVEADDGRTVLTRNGNFHLDNRGMLVTNEGMPVIGEQGGMFLPQNVATDQLRIDTQGRLVADTDNGEILVGKFALVEVETLEGLDRLSANYYVQTPRAGEVKPAADTELIHRALENSNVSPLMEMADMIESMREYETAQTMIRMTDDTLKKQVDMV